ncbi:E3 ubiquitin-protein ligase rnf213-alpha-like, partial [Actinia tenebrosa]|uniref:E3 ubiquitin-protein ligase rnf213-alpha-like n=1 Tax=Actinia tenebrosa TaxID=6105 RepID=A0A6P8HCB4_ACTTE
MECINPDCTKADLLKRLFAGVEKAEDLPKICPYCGSSGLRQISAINITKDETTISTANDETTTGPREEKSLEASSIIKNSPGHQNTVENKDERKTPVNDEKPAVRLNIDSQHDINDNVHGIQYTSTKESNATKGKQVPDVVKQQNAGSSEDMSCPSISSNKGLQTTSDTSSCHVPLLSQVHTDSSVESSVDKTILHKSDHGGREMSETSTVVRAHMSVIDDNMHSNHHASTVESDGTKSKQVSADVKQNTGSEGVSCPSTSDQGLQTASDTSTCCEALLNEVHTNSSLESNVDTILSKSIDHGVRKSEKSKVDKTHTSEQSNNAKEAFETPPYNTRLRVSLNNKQKQASKPKNQGSLEPMNNQQHQSSDQRTNGVNGKSLKGSVTILGTACVFGKTNESMPCSSSATEDSNLTPDNNQLEKKHSQAKEQTYVNKDNGEAISKANEKSMDLDPEKNADKGGAERENDSKLPVQAKGDDNKSGSASNTDQESESEEETNKPSEQKSGPVPYDKEVIKEKKKKRKNKKKGKKTSKKEPQKEEEPQASTSIDAKAQMTMTTQHEKNNSTHGKQENQPVEHKNSREQLRDIQCTVNAPPPPDVTAQDCVTVIFHALLSPDFHFNPKKQKISIKVGLEELGGWKYNCANDFTVIGEIGKERFVSITGKMQVPVRFLSRALPYKYVVYTGNGKNQKIRWEYSEFRNDHPGTIVNRDLCLLEKHRTKNAIYHQYDGVIYPQPERANLLNQVVSWVTSPWHDRKQQFLKYRLLAAETFLPKWKGFVVHGEYEQMSAKEAIEKTQAILRCLTDVYVCLGHHPEKKTFDGLYFKKFLINFLKPKLEYNANLSDKKDLESTPVRVDRLVSTLAITHLIAHYKLDLEYFQFNDILHCLVIQGNGSGGCDFDEVHKHFPEEMWSDLVKSILHLMKAAKDKYNHYSCPDIILAVPLLHFLRKDLKPFEEPEVTHQNTVKEWCCAEGVPQNKTYNSFVETFLPKVKPMFTLDPLLRRLFLHYTPLEDFPKLSGHIAFPVYEICTALFYKVRNGNIYTPKFDTVDETLSNLMKRQTSKQREEKLGQSKALLFADLSMCLLQELNKKVQSKDKLFFTGIQFAMEALCSVDGPEDERKTMENQRQGQLTDDDIKHKCEDIFFKIEDMVESAIKKEFYSPLSSYMAQQVKELKVWSTLLNLNVSRKNVEDNWINRIVSLFEKRLKEVNDEDVVELFCEVEMNDKFHQALVQSITQHTFSIVERIVEKGGSDERSFNALHKRILRSGGSSKAGELLSRMITRAWSKATANKTVTDHDVLLYALTWRPWAGFFSFHGSQEKKRILSEDASNLLQRVIGCLVTAQDGLSDGSINVRTLTSLNQHEDNFIHLCIALSKIQTKSEENQKPHSVEDVRRNLDERNEEYRLFLTTKGHVQHFIDICKSTKDVAFDFVSLQVKAACDMSNVRMADLCKRVPPGDDHSEERVEVVYFDCLPNRFHSILPLLSDAYKSKTFQDIWRRNCKALYTEKKGNQLLSGELTLLDVQEKVWPSSNVKWTLLAKTVYDGSIHLKDVDRKITLEKGLKEELDIMFWQTVNEIPPTMDKVASERVSQITRYRSLQEYIGAAENVWNFKEALGLKGDFGVIEELRNQASKEFKDKDLKSIDEKFTKAGKYLNQISFENSHCLDAVIKCEPLVKWLRETIKDTSALSTLVDLAMISAGENDFEVDRISNFHTSCLSFAPLIFDLNEEFGFEDLMEACKPVWEAVKQDRKLSVKLAETCRHLEWLKAVQSSHGSVEMSSIMQAKAINSSGVFRVGQITQDPNGNLSVSSEKKDLENVLTLTVPIDPRTRDPRRQ